MRFYLLLPLMVACACAGCGARVDNRPPQADAPQGPRIELVNESGGLARFEVLGLDGRALAAFESPQSPEAPLFEVFVAGVDADAPALVGTTTLVAGRPTFAPRYPLAGGLRYRAQLHLARLVGSDTQSGDLVAEFAIPKPPPQPASAVEHIYPSADALPENQLKFYLHFSGAMSRGEVYRRLHLVGEDGSEIEGPFLELGEELWDPEMRRFTLFCDPGRVKRGLKPREEFGPVLEEGKQYTLVVDRAWPDANGTPLVREVRKRFRALAPDDVPIDPAAWHVEPPPAGGVAPLIVQFTEPLDHSLALRMITVVDAAGKEIAGSTELVDQERSWQFTPRESWQPGDYQLVVDTALEDLAGNAVGRAFDADRVPEAPNRISEQAVSVPFSISP